jgi:hypothetical protein
MAWLLVAVNLFPFAGNYFWGWDTHTLLFIYWSETVILWLFQSLKVLLTLGWATLSTLAWGTVFFAMLMMFAFLFICGTAGLFHGVSSMTISSAGMTTVVIPAQKGQTHHLWAFLADLFWRQKLWAVLDLLLSFHALSFLIFWVKKVRSRPVAVNGPVHHPLDDLGSVEDPTVEMIAELKSRYKNLVPPIPKSHPSQALRDNNLGKAVGLLLVEPMKRMMYLFISVFIGMMAGILIPVLISVLLGRLVGIGSFLHLDWWILAFLIWFKVYFDLLHLGRRGGTKGSDPQIQN